MDSHRVLSGVKFSMTLAGVVERTTVTIGGDLGRQMATAYDACDTFDHLILAGGRCSCGFYGLDEE